MEIVRDADARADQNKVYTLKLNILSNSITACLNLRTVRTETVLVRAYGESWYWSQRQDPKDTKISFRSFRYNTLLLQRLDVQ
jgi:hypothetical protein